MGEEIQRAKILSVFMQIPDRRYCRQISCGWDGGAADLLCLRTHTQTRNIYKCNPAVVSRYKHHQTQRKRGAILSQLDTAEKRQHKHEAVCCRYSFISFSRLFFAGWTCILALTNRRRDFCALGYVRWPILGG